MAEYIDKSAVVAKIDEFVEINKAHGFPVDIFDMEMLKRRIEQIPAADVAPVVHGRWVYHNFDTICSECRKSAIFDEWEQQAETEFCPHCGAKMDEEVNGICADDKQNLKTCRTCKNYTPNHGYRDGEMGTCCFWKSITGNCMAVHQSRIGCEHYDKKI